MNIITFRQFIAAFNKTAWYIRYIITITIVYIPGILAALAAGTFAPGGSHICERYFVTDFPFHYCWLFIIPISLLILPKAYRSMDEAINDLRKCTPPILDEDLTKSTIMHRSSNHSLHLLIGTALGFTIVTFIAVMNQLSMVAQDRSQFSWWYPSKDSYAAFVYFFTISFIATSIAFNFLVRYLYVIRLLREGVLKVYLLPTWIGSSEGSIDNLFRYVFLLCVPGSTISLSIIINRIIFGMKAWDFALLFNIVMIPLAFTLGLVLPVIYCGIPKKFSQQRSKLLLALDKEIAQFMRSANEQPEGFKDSGLYDDLEAAIKKKELIRKNYPILPLGSITKMVSVMPIIISAAPTLFTIIKIIIASPTK